MAGNSLGGWVALELAAAGHARSVTAIAPAGLWPEPLAPKRGIARGLAKVIRPGLPALVRSPAGRRLALAATVADAERVPPAAALRLVRAYADAPGFEAVNRAMRAGRFTRLEHIRVPVTLAWPEHDRLVARPAHLPPTVRNVALPGAGHVPMWDAPERSPRCCCRGAVRPPEAPRVAASCCSLLAEPVAARERARVVRGRRPSGGRPARCRPSSRAISRVAVGRRAPA